MIRRFARPYARAIMDVAGSPAKANELRGELMRFADALRSSSELREFYANPAIDEQAKIAVTKRLASKMKASDLAAKTLEVLVQNHRINDLDAILEALASYVNAALGVAVAEVRAIHERAAAEGERQKRELIAAAEAESQKMLAAARNEVDNRLKHARHELTEYAGQLATERAEAILRENITEQDQRNLFQESLRQVGEVRS